jgi:molybdopterin-guanine dinucleotide biosynthesis protein A
MGGYDKALLQIGGCPLLAHVIARLQPQVLPLVLSANGGRSCFANFRLTTLPDPHEPFGGPLGGILAGLQWMRADTAARWLVTVPVDTPFLPRLFVARLLACSENPAQIAVARSYGKSTRLPRFGPFNWRTLLRTGYFRRGSAQSGIGSRHNPG